MTEQKQERFIIRSRTVFTGLGDAPQAARVAVQGGRIAALLPWAGSEDEPYADWPVHDYGERLVMPSFVDAHTHLFQGALEESEYVCNTLGSCRSQEECVREMAIFADRHPEYPVLRGSGWFLAAWTDDSYPDRRLLDKALGDRPAFLMNADCHSMWLNTAALRMADLGDDYAPPGGEALRLSDGSLSGLLLEPEAYAPAEAIYSDFTDEELQEVHRAFQQKIAAYGIGALSEMFADDYTPETARRYGLVCALDKTEGLSAQVYVYTRLFGYTSFEKFRALQADCASPHFHLAGLKGFIDGVTETYTGLLLEPYTDDPSTCGQLKPPPREQMEREIAAANREGLQVRLHCIGDGAVRLALDLYEHSYRENGEKERQARNTIEHIENIHPYDIPRFAELGVVPSMQPYHLTLSNNGKVRQLGEKRCVLEFPVRTMQEACGHLAIGTDFPVVTINPFTTIYAALTRCDDRGVPTGRNGAAQKLSLAEVLHAYTREGARVYHAEDDFGTLEAGKCANVIVLDRNLFRCVPEEIRRARVDVNYFEGREIYRMES